MRLLLKYVNGSVSNIRCTTKLKKEDLDRWLASGAKWLEYDKGHYINLTQVMSITVLNPTASS